MSDTEQVKDETLCKLLKKLNEIRSELPTVRKQLAELESNESVIIEVLKLVKIQDPGPVR